MHARGSGPRVMMTRQPTEGKSKNGGLCLLLLYLHSEFDTVLILSIYDAGNNLGFPFFYFFS